MPAQKDWEDLWSQVYTMQLRTCLRFGAVSSGLVAFLTLIASSASDLGAMGSSQLDGHHGFAESKDESRGRITDFV